MGLKVYERLSGKLSFGHSEVLSRKTALEKLPGVKSEGLRGGILYHDGQFDDARYAIALLRTLQDLGGVAINYVEATGLIERGGKVIGIRARDQEERRTTSNSRPRRCQCLPAFTSNRHSALDGSPRESLLAVSQGSHFVLPRPSCPEIPR